MHPNVRYELQELERLISLHWEKVGRFENALEEYDISTIKNEVGRIKKTFIYEVFAFSDERHLERYIQYHQQELIRLVDQLLGILKADHLEGSADRSIFENIHLHLEELLSYIEKHFTRYFDQDAKAPESYRQMASKEVQSNLEFLHRLLDGKKADPRLVETVLYPLRSLIDGTPQNEMTYRKVIYVKEMRRNCYLLENVGDSQDIDEELRLIIYYLNYNSIKSFTYHTGYINLLISELETRSAKIEKLSFMLEKDQSGTSQTRF